MNKLALAGLLAACTLASAVAAEYDSAGQLSPAAPVAPAGAVDAAGLAGAVANGVAGRKKKAHRLYVDPNGDAAAWSAANPGDGRAADIASTIASQPIARWFGDWSGDIASAVGNYVGAAAAAGQRPVLVAYDIPGRDCGQYSAGGADSIPGYEAWIHDFAAAIGARKALVVLEPDALPQIDCLSADGQAGRLQMLQYAVAQFKTLAPKAWLYLDIGNSSWLSTADATSRLVAAGIADAHGFSLNVSNYRTDAESNAYGSAIASALKQKGLSKTFVVDTSRNGNGPLGSEWCDPAGRKVGARPKQNPVGTQPEMTLWVKPPGDADGCAAAAGVFSPQIAYDLVHGN